MSNGTTRENEHVRVYNADHTGYKIQCTTSKCMKDQRRCVMLVLYTYIVNEVPDTQLKENILVCAQVCNGHRFQAVQEVPVY